MQIKICAVYGEGVKNGLRSFVLEISCWTMDDDAPRSGGPAEIDSDVTETFIENNQCYTTWEIAYIFKVHKSIKLLVEMKNVYFIFWKKLNKLFGQPSKCKRAAYRVSAQ